MRKTNMKQKLTKLEKYWVLYDVGKLCIYAVSVHDHPDLF